MKTKPSSHSDILALWGIQESLLQQYRGIFITMQSILLAVSVAIPKPSEHLIPFMTLFILGLLGLWLWVTICARRGRAVYLCQFLVLKSEDGEVVNNPVKVIKDAEDGDYIHQGFATDARFKSLHVNHTRGKMQILLPLGFLIAWVVLFVSIIV